MGEFELIESIRRRFAVPRGFLGIGDDCAVIPHGDGTETLVSTDLLVEDVHFLPGLMPAFDLGWKSAAVNISDIAAMGCTPVGTFLSIALPERFRDRAWLDGFFDGYAEISRLYGCPLLGGDTTSSPDRLCINVTVLGSAPAGCSIKRSGAKPGDMVCVSGPLGDSAAGLKLLTAAGAERTDATHNPDADGRSASPAYADSRLLCGGNVDTYADKLIARHFRPQPRVELGFALRESGAVHSMMDISDGVASDLRHILKASGVSAEIDCASVPFSDSLKTVCAEKGWDALELALCGGEDYELLFTIDASSLAAVETAFSSAPGTSLHVIGRIKESAGDSGIVWLGSRRDFSGFRHF